MRYSKLGIKTNKVAKEYNSINATLLTKAGFVDQVMSGVYTFLPLGLRVLNKIENIVRKEMDKIGVEILMPALSLKENWITTGRLEKINVLFKVVGANKESLKTNNAEYILNCTHEDLITPLALKHNLSYKDFPFAFYQIQTKFRNEPRAKSGILRGREFRMKDLYSFHTSEKDLLEFYHNIAKPAYFKVFEKVGIGKDTVVALASGGDFTKDFSHEFQTFCEAGEDQLFYDEEKDIYYNREVTPSKAPQVKITNSKMEDRKDILGEGIIGVAELADFLKIDIQQTTKTLLYKNEQDEFIAAAVRGGYDINEEKLKKVTNSQNIEMASKEDVKKVTGAEIGYVGIINLPNYVKLIIDESCDNRINFESGANKTNFHTINLNWGRDIQKPEKFYDIKLAKEGDLNPESGKLYKCFNSSEVGNIFPLNTKFSKAFDYYFVDKDGKRKEIFMGSYGIGTSRLMGLLVEKFHDDKGIIWPESVAPFKVHLIGLDLNEDSIKNKADKTYEYLLNEGIEVLFDDRIDATAGQKFSDADLIGIPCRLVVSKRTGNQVELKKRNEEKAKLVNIKEVLKNS